MKVKRDRGTPQGGPLSQLLANVMLDEVDKVLEARDYCCARYADHLHCDDPLRPGPRSSDEAAVPQAGGWASSTQRAYSVSRN